MRDRGFIVLFGGTCSAVYLLFTFLPVTYHSLLAAQLVLSTCFLFVVSAQNGLTSTFGQQHLMSGQISAVWNVAASLPGIIALVLGGYLSDVMERRDGQGAAHLLFLVGAAIMAFGRTVWPVAARDRVRQPAGRAPRKCASAR
jgi:hypothetical protein